MDSKSISRKGVGVRVPASAPDSGADAPRALADPLARAMLPVLLHRVANATQHLNGLSALIAADPAALEARGDDLAATSGDVDETGWLLALLASASGARMLLARRERAGLRPVLACVRACLRRERRDLEEPGGPLPDLVADADDGWQVPWAIASFLHEAGRAISDGERLAWSLTPDEGGWQLACPTPAPGAARLGAWLARHLPGSRLDLGGGGAALHLPHGALAPAAVSP